MSPSEFDLRAALREGDGDVRPPDADAIIARAEGIRRSRRVRFAQLAAAVVVTGLVGVGAVALRAGGHTSGAGSSANLGESAGQQYSARSDGTPAAGVAAPVPSAAGNDAAAGTGAAACPATPPRLAAPGGGGTGQFGGDGPMFAGAPASVTVCVYRSGAVTGTGTVTGRDAAEVATTLNAAATRNTASCPVPSEATRGAQILLLGSAADGTPLPMVLGQLSCPNFTTNGTSVRYLWTPPQRVRALVDAGLSASAPGRVSGSPAR